MANRQSNDSQRYLSHGRGGAGNLGHDEPDYHNTAPPTVPQLKSDYYTTGRGGNANMMKNSDPNLARQAQDVEGYNPVSSSADYYQGRGGAGNRHPATEAEREAARLEAEEERRRKEQEKNQPVDHSKHDYRGWADKGKDLLLYVVTFGGLLGGGNKKK